jgi:predicted acetyltransferase
MLDRGPYVWQRTRATRDGPAAGFGVFASGGELEGYVYLLQARKPETGHHDVTVSDLAFVTAAAGRRLLGFLSDFATVGDEVVLAGGPLHPLLSLIDERRYRVEKKDYWMVRVLDVGRAIGARGVGNGRRAACVVDVDDPLIAESHGRWTVSVAEGQGSAVRGGAAEAVRCGVRTLAALYTGLYSARQAALRGWVTGREEGVDALEGVFAGGGGAWMSDFF